MSINLNNNILNQDFKPQNTLLDKGEVALLNTILAGATQSNDKTKAGRGYMGLAMLGGKPAPVKYLTHWRERGIGNDAKIMKSVYEKLDEGGDAAFSASDDLERVLIKLAEKVGIGETVRDLIDGYKAGAQYRGKSLLSRKIVFAAVTTINDKLAKKSKISLDTLDTEAWHWNDTSIDGVAVLGFRRYGADSLAGLCKAVDPSKNGFVDACIEKIDHAFDEENGGRLAEKLGQLGDAFGGVNMDKQAVLEKIEGCLPRLIRGIGRSRSSDNRMKKNISEVLAIEIRKTLPQSYDEQSIGRLSSLCDDLTEIIVAHIREWTRNGPDMSAGLAKVKAQIKANIAEVRKVLATFEKKGVKPLKVAGQDVSPNDYEDLLVSQLARLKLEKGGNVRYVDIENYLGGKWSGYHAVKGDFTVDDSLWKAMNQSV